MGLSFTSCHLPAVSYKRIIPAPLIFISFDGNPFDRLYYIVLSSKRDLHYSSALKNVDVKDANKMFQSHFIHCKFLSISIDSGKLM